MYLVFKTVEYSIQLGYYKKVQDVLDALYKAGLANLTEVVLSYDDTSKRVTVKCGRRVVVKLRGDIARMLGFLDDTTIRASDEKGFTLALSKIFLRFHGYYHGDVVVPILCTVTIKGKHESYVSKNFERPHYVPLNKNIFDTISINIRKMCKNNRGLKIHQDKTISQTPENNLVAPPQKCFVSLQNVILSSCLTFDDSIYYRTSDNTFIPISNSEKPVTGNKCYVQMKDIIIHPLTEYLSSDINQCGATSCHTCNIFVNNQSFESNLTGKEYKPISYDRLSCGSRNVIYGIHCVHCGLVYVGETGRSLRSGMNGHRSAIKKGGQSLLHRHFHQPDHSVDDMRVQILEKVYHSSENPTLLTSVRGTRELFWIKELGTAKPYGFNDQIKGVGTLSSISCKKTNIYSLFNKQPRRKRSHGKRHYNKRTPQPDATTSTLVDLVDMIEKPEGVHNINTKLFSISFPQLRSLQKLALESTNFDYSSAEYRVIAIILDIANYRLFRPVRSDVQRRSQNIL